MGNPDLVIQLSPADFVPLELRFIWRYEYSPGSTGEFRFVLCVRRYPDAMADATEYGSATSTKE